MDGDNNPVECVSWYDAVEYCNKRSEKEGLTPCYTIDKYKQDPNNENGYDDIKWTVICNFKANGYRLPTETEWEYAARGGNKSKGFKYSGSNNLDDVAWYNDNSGDETHPVKQKNPNELGIYDMTGNVWEWCWDWYDYENGDYPNQTKDYAGPSSGCLRVDRGGSYYCHGIDDYCAVDYRHHYDSPYGRDGDLGFRLVRSSGK